MRLPWPCLLLAPAAAADCALCMEPMGPGAQVRGLPCGHHFHRECIDRWLAVKRVCPSCKFDVSGRGAGS